MSRRRTLRNRLAMLVLAALAAAGALPESRAQEEWRAAPSRVPVVYKDVQATLATIPGEDHPRLIKGSEEIVWTNTTRDVVESLYFHLYPNAFEEGGRSAFLRERARDGGELPEKMLWGGCDVQSVEIPDTPGRLPERSFVPWPGAPDDRTVLKVTLPQPVEPFGQVTLRVLFTTTLPTPVARMGAVKDFVFAAQWFPKLGRYLGRDAKVPHLLDGWYCHHYHAATEFAADFADYTVTLTTPLDWNVDATGVPQGRGRTDPVKETRTTTFVAKNVVDFAWVAGREARLVSRTRTIDPDDAAREDAVANEVRRVMAVHALDGGSWDLPPVDVTVLFPPEHEDQAERHFEAARVALALYGAWLGPYPYGRLVIVDPPHAAAAVGGMEYPMLVTGGTTVGSPRAALRPEHVVVHEIGHQWFMNLLASNEAEEAWLDEALNTWFTARAMDVAWGPAAQHTAVAGLHFETELPYRFPGLTSGWPGFVGLPRWLHPAKLEGFALWRDGPMLLATSGSRYQRRDQNVPAGWPHGHGQSAVLPSRRSYLRNDPGMDELVKFGPEFASIASYRGNAYPRGVLLLESVARHVRARAIAEQGPAGAADAERRLLRAFRVYARTYRFGHPTTADLVRVLRQELAMPDLPQLFDALARTAGLLDYAVARVRTTEEKPRGAPEDAKPVVRSTVRVLRRGDVVVPVTLRVASEVEGRDEPVVSDLAWDGAARWRDFEVEGRVRSAWVDPHQLFPQDARLSDNAWTHDTSWQPTVKWGSHALLWLEHAIASYGRFF